MNQIMKKYLLVLCLLMLITLVTSCDNIDDKGQELSIEQAYEQYGIMVENFQKDYDKKPSFNSVYFKEESYELDSSSVYDDYEEKYTTTIISFNKENYHYHLEKYSENKTTDTSTSEIKDMYVKDDKLHFFRTYIIDKRVAYKKYYICDLDYLWTYESKYGGHMEEVLGETFIKNVEDNLLKDNLLNALRNNYYFILDNSYEQVPSLEKFTEYLSDSQTLSITTNPDANKFSFHSTFAADSEVVEYNLAIEELVVYTNGLLTEDKRDYYEGNYCYKTYQYDIEIPLPELNIADYEETEPNRIDVDFISWTHYVY